MMAYLSAYLHVAPFSCNRIESSVNHAVKR